MSLFLLILIHLNAYSSEGNATPVCATLESCKLMIAKGNVCAIGLYVLLAVKMDDIVKKNSVSTTNINRKQAEADFQKELAKRLDSVMKPYLQVVSNDKTLCGARSQVGFAMLYSLSGDTTLKKDWFKKSVSTYEYLAKNGSLKAQYELGRNYDSVYGINPDIKKRNYWYQQTINNGEVGENGISIALQLGAYYSDKGDFPEALKWYKNRSSINRR